ncbi:MAG TPA: protein kinase [Candidatus Eisenbacteria bacterium]|nr:protein kinase [Candidatus Eisenbacteria bacterium]
MSHTLAPGTRLGPYEILALLGVGGMGEVYRARDGRLGRDVAVKVLPSTFVSDPDRLKRFQREARAAGQLNHPNIIAIYDVGAEGDIPYIVSELLAGEDLRAALKAGPFPPRRAVAYAVQIAKGLSAAHAKGIAHRDLKPENVMLVGRDHVKILDFGLAKILYGESGAADPDKTGPIGTQLTATGTILGTASYMSPEQIREQPTDHRTDIFAVGAIIYELLTGRRAFDGDTHADRMSAILSAEPKPLPSEIEDAAPGITAVIAHCLEKGVDDRFDTARDLAFALSMVEAAVSAARRSATGAAAEDAGHGPGDGAAETRRHTFRRTTYREGSILSARFSPDGQGICYGAAWEGRNVELFWAYPGNPESRALGFPKTDLLAIGATGEMAVSLRRHSRGGFLYTGMLARMPVGGGAPRELLDDVYEADWSPDGRQLAVMREEAGRTRIEYPMGTPIYQTTGWVSHIRVSRDGKRVAFLDHPTRGDDMGSAAVVDTAGNVARLSTGWNSARGLAWSPDGNEIVFTAFRTGVGRSLYAVSLDGKERPILEVPGHMTLFDISRQGAALVILENERARTQYMPPGEAIARDLTWLDWTLVRALSPDGSRILFDETGVGGGDLHSVYLRGTDGSPAIRLGDGACFSMSPDGQWALAGVGYAPTRLDLLPCGAGTARTIPAAGLDVHHAVWFPDGETLCVMGQEEGHGTRLYKVDSVTGKFEAFTDEGISATDLLVSPDGSLVAARGPDLTMMRFPVAGGTPEPVKGFATNDRPIRWSKDGGAIFAFTRGVLPSKIHRIDLATGERTVWAELAPTDPTGVEGLTGVRMTDDERGYAYAYSQRLNDLFVVEGLF